MNAEKLPGDLLKRLGPAVWHPIEIGQSGARTYRLEAGDGTSTYLKVRDAGGPDTLREEAERLAWLKDKLPVPGLLDYRQLPDREILWMSAMPGIHAADDRWTDRLPEMVRALAQGLRRIHALNIEDCPFDRRVAACVQEAGRRLSEGQVDQDDFDADREGCSAEELYAKLMATVPQEEDLVFTHGDYCLPNIVLDEALNAGFIDWGRAGVADRYQDIALAVRSLSSNFGPEWTEVFLAAYGLERPDRAKLEFYRLLDEFF